MNKFSYTGIEKTVQGHLWRQSLLVVDNNTPSKIEILVLDLDKPPGLEEGQTVIWMCDDFPEVGGHLIQLLTVLVVLGDKLLIGNNYRRLFGLFLTQLYRWHEI
jgi:hypothetical protein